MSAHAQPRLALCALSAVLASAALSAVDAPALAQAPSSAPSTPEAPPVAWYGWQILIPGIISHALTAAGAFIATSPIIFPGLAGSIFSAPIVHWVHGHTARGFASLGIQMGATTIAAGLWYVGLITSIDGNGAGSYYALSSVGLGVMATGLVLDSVLLAREPILPGDAARRSFNASNVSIAPLVLPFPEAHSSGKSAPLWGLSLVGTF